MSDEEKGSTSKVFEFLRRMEDLEFTNQKFKEEIERLLIMLKGAEKTYIYSFKHLVDKENELLMELEGDEDDYKDFPIVPMIQDILNYKNDMYSFFARIQSMIVDCLENLSAIDEEREKEIVELRFKAQAVRVEEVTPSKMEIFREKLLEEIDEWRTLSKEERFKKYQNQHELYKSDPKIQRIITECYELKLKEWSE